ncbi:hypothetical protein EON66_00075 [archaeon]|nr:MAG: hypothetical protein EON66_00075 [archaeon]
MWQPDAFALRQYGDAYVAPPSTQFRLLVGRQRRLLLRDSIFMYTRVIGCVVMGLILGSLFYQVGVAEFNLKLGVALFAIIHLCTCTRVRLSCPCTHFTQRYAVRACTHVRR